MSSPRSPAVHVLIRKSRVLPFIKSHCQFFAVAVQLGPHQHAFTGLNYPVGNPSVIELTNVFFHRNVWQSATAFESNRIDQGWINGSLLN